MENRPSLFTGAMELKALEELFCLDGGEITEVHEELQKEAIRSIEQKTDGCVEYINRLRADIEAIKVEKKRINDECEKLISLKEGKIDDFIKYVEFCIGMSGQEKFVGNYYSIKKMKGRKKLVVKDIDKLPLHCVEEIPETYQANIENIQKAIEEGKKEDIPMEFFTVIPTEYKADIKKINEAIKKGEKLEGIDYEIGKSSIKIGVKAKKD